MLFTGLVWFWRNAFEPPLKALGRPGQGLAWVIYQLLIYIPGMSMAFLAMLLYPPKIIVRPPAADPSSNKPRVG